MIESESKENINVVESDTKIEISKVEKKKGKGKSADYRTSKYKHITPDELELVISGCVCSVRVKNSPFTNHLKLKSMVSVEAVSILQYMRLSVQSGISDFNSEYFKDLLNKSMLLYTGLQDSELDFIYKAIDFLDWSNKNIFINTIMTKLRSLYSAEIQRLKLLQGSIQSGHSNSEVLKEYVELVRRLVSLRLIPPAYAKSLISKVSNLFLDNVRQDIKSRDMSINAKTRA